MVFLVVLRKVVVRSSFSVEIRWSIWLVQAQFPPIHIPLRAEKAIVAILTVFQTKAHLPPQ